MIRRATAQDQWRLRQLVLSAKLDPTQLRWQQFWVIEYQEKVIACGQLRSFEKAQELGSLVVAKPWRDRGLGTVLTQHLIEEATQPLYLECLGKRLAQFYARFGFVPVSWQALPRSLQLKFGLSQLAKTVLRLPVAIMVQQGESKSPS
jgi:amino-acid N-acetyltransferase